MNKPAPPEVAAAMERMRARYADAERLAARSRRAVPLPVWYEQEGNAYFCSLIARQIRTRAHMRGQTDAARGEALAIADMIETGDFDWLV